MTFELSREHEEFRRSVREFVEREVVPIADELDNAEKEIPMKVIGKMAELGYFGLIFPTEYGGMGLDYSYQMVVTEELGTCAAGAIPMAIGVLTAVATNTIARLPKIALERPPALPGGGVGCVKSVGDSAANPFNTSTPRIHSRNAIPNAMVASDAARLKRLTHSRRR